MKKGHPERKSGPSSEVCEAIVESMEKNRLEYSLIGGNSPFFRKLERMSKKTFLPIVSSDLPGLKVKIFDAPHYRTNEKRIELNGITSKKIPLGSNTRVMYLKICPERTDIESIKCKKDIPGKVKMILRNDVGFGNEEENPRCDYTYSEQDFCYRRHNNTNLHDVVVGMKRWGT